MALYMWKMTQPLNLGNSSTCNMGMNLENMTKTLRLELKNCCCKMKDLYMIRFIESKRGVMLVKGRKRGVTIQGQEFSVSQDEGAGVCCVF